MRILFGIIALLFTTAQASPYVPIQSCPGDFSLEAEWLYFSPTSETRPIAINTVTTSDTGTIESVNFDKYYSGYRIGAAYTFCECDRFLSVTWTSFKASETDRFTSSATGIIVPVDITFLSSTFNEVNVTERFSYYAIDAVLGQNVLSTCCVNLDVLGGIHYAHLLNSDNQIFPPFTSPRGLTISQKNNFWGVGPEFGIHAEIPLCLGFSFVSNVASSFIIGRPNQTYLTTDAVNFSYTARRHWKLVPQLDARLEIDYVFSFPCNIACLHNCVSNGIRGKVSVGYETLCYFDGLASLSPIAAGSVVTTYRNVTMHGPFVALALSF